MTFKSLFISLIFSLCSVTTYSQATPDKLPTGDTTLVIPTEFSNSLDFMLQSWAVRRAAKSNCPSSEVPPLLSDSVCKLRLSKLPYLMEMPYNATVRSFIDLYTIRKRRQMEYMLGMSEYYFPVFEQVLGANNLPLELKYLSIIESALNTTIVSRMGAAGLWQLMIATGKMYGLEINSLVDERLSPAKATNAAAHFMKDLHSIYGDWNLVIAAYNCGPGNVNKAIRKAGGKRDYWAIYPYLPKETRGYVPIFIAANYSLHYAREHNLCSANVNMPAITDTIMVRKRIHLLQVASILHLPIELVRLLNPQYRKDIIPGNTKPYALCLPLKYITLYMEKEDSILAYKTDSLVNNRRGEIEIVENQKNTDSSGGGKLKLHKVLKGQSLKTIAAKYGISVSKLKSWNGIKGDKAKVGTLLRVSKYNAESAVEAVKPVVDERKATLDEPAVKPTVSETPQLHLVVSGQSLFSIANIYGVTVENLKLWNGLKDAQVKVGDRLKIRPLNSELAKKEKTIDVETEKKRGVVETEPTKAKSEKVTYHIVKHGQGLSAIATQYNVTVDNLKKWNKLKSNQLNLGDRLIVSNSTSDIPVEPTMSKKMVEEKKSVEAVAKVNPNENFKIHIVTKKQSLAAIAKKYHVSVQNIKAWNQLKDNHIQKGDRLKISTIEKDESTAFKSEKVIKTAENRKVQELESKPSENEKTMSHTVVKGETMSSIATQFGLRVEELKQLNHLSGTKLAIGDKLVVQKTALQSKVDISAKQEEKTAKVKQVEVEKKGVAEVEKPKTHIVTHGESLASIASKYGITVGDLKKWNRLKITRLDIGDCLYLTATGIENSVEKSSKSGEDKAQKSKSKHKIKTHTVTRGQNLSTIANRYGVSVEDLKKWNDLKDARLSIGDKIKLGE
jgi:membrane-bound lytic murein transglycosylase D